MNSRYFLLFTVLISSVPVSGAQFARRCAQFAKQYPAPLVGTGLAGFSYFKNISHHRKIIDECIALEKEQMSEGIINLTVKQLIRDECERNGWSPDFIVYNSALSRTMGVISDGIRAGLLVGYGWGLQVEEQESRFSTETFRFLIGHESTHARYHDGAQRIKVIALQSFLQSVVWHVLRASGRGKAFSLLVSVFGGGLSYQFFVNAPFNKSQELRADKEAAKRDPGNIASFIEEILRVDAWEEKMRLRTIDAVMSGRADESEKDMVFLELLKQFSRMISHPASLRRIEQLEQIKEQVNK